MSKRENGTTGLLQDFLVEMYQKKVNDFSGPDEHGEVGNGDLLLKHLHFDFGQSVDADAPVEEKLEELRKVVGDAARDLSTLLEALYSEVSEPVQRAIAAERMGEKISQAMPGDDPSPGRRSSGPSPI